MLYLKARLRKLLLVGAAAATLVVGLPAQSAFAAHNCQGTCDRKDPQTSGCATAPGTYVARTSYIYSHVQRGLLIGVVELKYSPECGTNWTKVTLKNISPGSTIRLSGKVFRAGDPNPESESLTGYSSIYTNMLYAPTTCATGWGRVTYGLEYDEVTTAQAC